MKRFRIQARLGLLAFAFAAISSCSLFGPPTGRISIPFPSAILTSGAEGSVLPTSRAIPAPGTELRYVRIYLESQGGLIPLVGASKVYEAGIPGDNTITIDGIPPLRNCVLYLSLGVNSGADFRAAKYVKSGIFNIAAGATSTVTLTVQDSPFADQLTLGDSQGVRALSLGGHSYYLAGGRLYIDGATSTYLQVTGGANNILVANGLGAGKAQNADGSFDFSQDRVWIAADNGVWILSADGGSLAQLKVLDTKGATRSISDILGAGAITINYTDSSLVGHSVDAIYYQGRGKLGGAASSDQGSWQWFDLADNLASLGDTLKNAIESSPSAMVADYAIDSSAEYAYAVMPAINSFRIGGDVVDKVTGIDTSNTSALIDAVLKGNTISLPTVSGIAPLITSVSKTGNTLYVGSDQGAFAFAVSASDGTITGAAQALALGKTVSVAKLRASTINGVAWTAILGRAGNLYLLKNDTLVATYPFYTGMPDFGGDARATGSLFWTDKGLMIAGTNGVVLLGNAQLPQ